MWTSSGARLSLYSSSKVYSSVTGCQLPAQRHSSPLPVWLLPEHAQSPAATGAERPQEVWKNTLAPTHMLLHIFANIIRLISYSNCIVDVRNYICRVVVIKLLVQPEIRNVHMGMKFLPLVLFLKLCIFPSGIGFGRHVSPRWALYQGFCEWCFSLSAFVTCVRKSSQFWHRYCHYFFSTLSYATTWWPMPVFCNTSYRTWR